MFVWFHDNGVPVLAADRRGAGNRLGVANTFTISVPLRFNRMKYFDKRMLCFQGLFELGETDI